VPSALQPVAAHVRLSDDDAILSNDDVRWRTRHDSNVWPLPSEGNGHSREAMTGSHEPGTRLREVGWPEPVASSVRARRPGAAGNPHQCVSAKRHSLENEAQLSDSAINPPKQRQGWWFRRTRRYHLNRLAEPSLTGQIGLARDIQRLSHREAGESSPPPILPLAIGDGLGAFIARLPLSRYSYIL